MYPIIYLVVFSTINTSINKYLVLFNVFIFFLFSVSCLSYDALPVLAATAVVTQAPDSMVAGDDGVDAVISQCEAVFQQNHSVLKVCMYAYVLHGIICYR